MSKERYLLATAASIAVVAPGASGWIVAVKSGQDATMAGPDLVATTWDGGR